MNPIIASASSGDIDWPTAIVVLGSFVFFAFLAWLFMRN